MISSIFFIWLTTACALSFFNVRNGILLFISYKFLVPYAKFSFFGMSLHFNYFLLLAFILFIFSILYDREKFDFAVINLFIVFILLVVFTSFFTTGEFDAALSSLRSFSIENFVLPIMIWQSYKDERSLKLLIKVIIFCLVIMSIYGIYCFATMSNPYITYLSSLFGEQDINETFSEIERVGFVGKIQSTTFHPFLWSVILSMCLFSITIFLEKPKTIYGIILIFLLVFNLFVSGTRTGIISFVAGLLLLISFSSLRTKLVFIVCFTIFLVSGTNTSVFGRFKPIVDSIIFFYDSDKDIGGSSLSLRKEQFSGALDLWEKGGYFFGNGFGWCSNYFANHGDHPVLLAFESSIYVVLIENGIVGVFIWAFLFLKLFQFNFSIYNIFNRRTKYEFHVINSFILGYLVFTLVSGFFGLSFFLILLVIMYKAIIFKNYSLICSQMMLRSK